MTDAPRWMIPSIAFALLACSPSSTASSAIIDLGITSPQALLDDLESASLFVVGPETGAVCDSSSGMVTSGAGTTGLIPIDLANASPVSAPLARTSPDGSPCPGGGVFCSGDVILPLDPTRPLTFQVVGYRAGSAYGAGCVTAAVATDPLRISLSMHRYSTPSVCGDAVLGVGEQCEGQGAPPADDAICDSACHSKEVLLSADNTSGGKSIPNLPALSKRAVSIAWSNAPSATNPNPFHAVFQDTNFAPGSGPEINYRQMSQDWYPITSPGLLAAQIRLPYAGGTSTGFDQRAQTQASPSVASLSDGSILVAYEDNRNDGTGAVNISLTHVSPEGQADNDLVYINTLGVGQSSSPSVAGGPSGRALVVWTDNASKRIRGRIWSTTGWVSGSDLSLSTQDGSYPRVAGFDNGWVIAWQGASSTDSSDVIARVIDANGAGAAPFVVNEVSAGVQDQVAVAAVASGEFLVAWHEGSNVMMQRYSASSAPASGDQGSAVNDAAAGAAERPAATGSVLAGGFFAVAWQTSSGEIQARLVDLASGYRANPVDGQEGSFMVSDSSIAGQRKAPAVVAGGGGYLVFAWQDDSAAHPGIYGRRFPLPL